MTSLMKSDDFTLMTQDFKPSIYFTLNLLPSKNQFLNLIFSFSLLVFINAVQPQRGKKLPSCLLKNRHCGENEENGKRKRWKKRKAIEEE